jgi:hypothetical protein
MIHHDGGLQPPSQSNRVKIQSRSRKAIGFFLFLLLDEKLAYEEVSICIDPGNDTIQSQL